jgi:hypothetical protein
MIVLRLSGSLPSFRLNLMFLTEITLLILILPTLSEYKYSLSIKNLKIADPLFRKEVGYLSSH